MDLLSFLTLALSIFGSALAAMSALRSHYESEIFAVLTKMELTLRDITADGGSQAAEPAEKKKVKVLFWKKVWSQGQWLPIALFIFFLVVVAILLWFSTPTSVGVQDEGFSLNSIPWGFARWFVSVFLGINIFCFFASLRARFAIRDRSADIDDLWQAVDNTGRKKEADLEPQ